MEKRKKRDLLWPVLFLIVFINGFEAGGKIAVPAAGTYACAS